MVEKGCQHRMVMRSSQHLPPGNSISKTPIFGWSGVLTLCSRTKLSSRGISSAALQPRFRHLRFILFVVISFCDPTKSAFFKLKLWSTNCFSLSAAAPQLRFSRFEQTWGAHPLAGKAQLQKHNEYFLTCTFKFTF